MQRYIDELRLLHALRLAVVATDEDGVVSFANEAAAEVYRCEREDLLGLDVRALTGAAPGAAPDRRPSGADGRAEPAFDPSAVLAGRTWSGDLELHRPGGGTFVAAVSATPIRNRDGEVTGAVVVAEDMTDIRRVESEAAASQARLRLAHEAARLGSWHWDMTEGVTVWDEALETMYGLPPGGFGGTFEAWLGTVHPDDRDRVMAVVQRALEERSSYVLRNRTVRPDGALQWIEAHGRVTVDEHGIPTGTIGCVRDITEEMAVRQREEESAARAALLQEVTSRLTGALTVAEVAEVLEAGLERVTEIVGAGVEVRLPDDLTTATGERLVAPDAPPLDAEDRQLLDTLASQCAIAAQRAQLFGRTRQIAEQLQSSLAASALPELARFELAAHSQPGGDELEHVGGDWYDAVATPTGALALVVGDVMGRGVPAATTMIRVRAGIRGLMTVDPSPRAVLTAADDLLARDAPEQFVTAVALVADPATAELVVCNAGHIPVVAARPDGSTAVLAEASGVPLGVVRPRERASVGEPLPAGTLLVVVTDGVVESRGRDLDAGIEQLRRLVDELRDHPVQEVVQRVAAMADPSLHDDVTVVAVRVR